MTVRILQGDCRDVLRTLPSASVHCCVTSPPYYGLRDYGAEGQMGLEATPGEFIAGLVAVLRECRRILRDDGTLWLNMGDTYASNGGPGWQGKNGQRADRRFTATRDTVAMREQARTAGDGYKPKDLMGMPWALAFALRDDGWYLRQDIIWAKPNPMPESVRDRCTKAHEYLFLLSKSPRYYYDQEAIVEPAESAGGAWPANWAQGEEPHDAVGFSAKVGRSGNKARKPAAARGVPVTPNGQSRGAVAGSVPWQGATRNKRSVWNIATQPFTEAHFATFPPALVEPCILAGCPRGGTVLDPFGGAGTVGLVADRLQRDAVLIELNPDYADMARRRIVDDAPLLQVVA